MKCKKHPGDLSSGAGVCASCLRERLFALMAAQAQAQARAQAQAQALAHRAAAAAAEEPRKSDAQPPPPPLSFPRSVSPYVSRRKSDDDRHHPHHHPHHRFYSTPQVAPTYSAASEGGAGGGGGGGLAFQRSYNKKSRKFSLLAYLFRSRSEKLDSDPNPDSSDADPRGCRASPSPSWLSFLPGRRRAQSRLSSFEEVSTVAAVDGRCGRPSRIPARGMSPALGEDSDGNTGGDRSPRGNGCSSETSLSPPWWRRTPVTPSYAPKSATRPRPGHSRNVSGFAFCLSPLVRASPSRNRKQKGCMPPEAGYSGEIGRASAKPHLATASSFGKNRSRKLADFGRAHHHNR